MTEKPIKAKRRRAIYDPRFHKFGVYLWRMPGSQGYVSDGQGHFMSINSEYGDLKRIAQLRDAAKAYGVTTGEAVFFPGQQQCTDEEYEEQKQRLMEGELPNEYDLAAIVEDYERKHGKRV